MYKTLLCLCFLGNTLSIAAQHTWVGRYNGPANKQDGVRAMAVASDGSVYVAGMSEGKKGNIDYAIVKYNPAGLPLWVARYNGTGNSTDNPYALAVDEGDNVYVTGGSIGTNGTYDYATVRYNSDGSFGWAVRYEGARNDIARDVQVKSGYVYVTGFADGANQFNGNEIITIKYDLSGIKKWEEDFDQAPDIYDGSATNREEGTSLAVDDAGNIYITGTSQKMVTLKYAYLNETTYGEAFVFPSTQPTGNGRKVLLDAAGNVIVYGFNAQVKKYAPDGTELWSKTYPSAAFWGMTLDPSGNVYVTGAQTQTTGGDDYLTIKYNNNDGSQAWAKTFNGGVAGLSNTARSVAYAGNGSHEFVYVTGRVAMKTGRTAVANIGTVKYNASTGEQLAAWFYDGTDKQGSSASEVTSNGQGLVYIGGETTYKTSFTDFTTLAYTDPLPAPVVTSNNLIEPENGTAGSFRLTNYPNPLRNAGYIEFELPQQAFTRVSLFDNAGREVQILANGKRSEGIHRITLNRNALSAGTYFVRLQTEKARAVSKVVLAR